MGDVTSNTWLTILMQRFAAAGPGIQPPLKVFERRHYQVKPFDPLLLYVTPPPLSPTKT